MLGIIHTCNDYYLYNVYMQLMHTKIMESSPVCLTKRRRQMHVHFLHFLQDIKNTAKAITTNITITTIINLVEIEIPSEDVDVVPGAAVEGSCVVERWVVGGCVGGISFVPSVQFEGSHSLASI